MATDSNIPKDDLKVEPKAEPDTIPEVTEPEQKVVEPPRITNEKEGNMKQRRAAKKLSEYSRDVSKRSETGGSGRSEDTEAETGGAGGTEESGSSESSPEAPPQQSSFNAGNVIAALGVGVAALCLYLSYKSPQEQSALSDGPPPPPPPPRTAPRAPPPSRFKRL